LKNIKGVKAMVPFKALLSKKYNWEVYTTLAKETSNIQSSYGTLGDYSGPLMLPFTINNPQKILKTYNYKAYRITEVDATNDFISHIAREQYNFTENEYAIIFIGYTKGLTFINNYFNKKEEYKYLDRISLYLQQSPSHKIRAYKSGKRVIIVTNQDNNDTDAAVFSAIPLFFKEEFEWDEKTIKYFQLANQKTPEAQNEMIKIFDSFTENILKNARKKELENILLTASNYQNTINLEALKEVQKQIRTLEDKLVNLYTEEKEKQAKVTFFKPNTDSTEIAEYILNNKFIVDYYSCRNKYIVVATEAPLEYVDVPTLKKMLTNINSYLYPQSNGIAIPDSVRNHETEFIRFLKDLFITGRYRVYTRSEVVLDFEKRIAYPLRYCSNYSTSMILDYKPKTWELVNRFKNSPERCITPHMHIEYYDCWSGNKTNIAKALSKNDIIGALDIVVNTTKDINVNDGAVFGRFIREGLYNPHEFYDHGRLLTNETVNKLMPGNQFKTIYDTEKDCFRTFDDIFKNDYLNNALQPIDI
jgi:hypothetical protein